MIISRHEKAGREEVVELKETERGAGGSGHTGTK
jgi:dUTPase